MNQSKTKAHKESSIISEPNATIVSSGKTTLLSKAQEEGEDEKGEKEEKEEEEIKTD